jgi:hypothetical protein
MPIPLRQLSVYKLAHVPSRFSLLAIFLKHCYEYNLSALSLFHIPNLPLTAIYIKVATFHANIPMATEKLIWL